MAGRASGSGSSSAADRFARRVLAVVTRIPPGRVSTYGEVAAMAGAPGAARAAGNVMATARIARACPTTGSSPPAACWAATATWHTKRALLAAEGLEVTRTRVRRFEEVRWPGAARDAAGA